MEQQGVLDLFDFYWFKQNPLEKSPATPFPSTCQYPEIRTQIEEPVVRRLKSLHQRSFSDDMSSKTNLLSPNSVLQPKLETILSGKEVTEVSEQNTKLELEKTSRKDLKGRRRRKGSRSLSDLEFEELKGLMDLGFVFPESEIDPKLIAIVPGLQRLGKKTGEEEDEEEESFDESTVSRPYLSEAWSVKRKEEDPLINWRIPAVSDGTELKDHLRFWAHAVASTVR